MLWILQRVAEGVGFERLLGRSVGVRSNPLSSTFAQVMRKQSAATSGWCWRTANRPALTSQGGAVVCGGLVYELLAARGGVVSLRRMRHHHRLRGALRPLGMTATDSARARRRGAVDVNGR
jgi:hypothetical protein